MLDFFRFHASAMELPLGISPQRVVYPSESHRVARTSEKRQGSIQVIKQARREVGHLSCQEKLTEMDQKKPGWGGGPNSFIPSGLSLPLVLFELFFNSIKNKTDDNANNSCLQKYKFAASTRKQLIIDCCQTTF